jgi:hypothetical protein
LRQHRLTVCEETPEPRPQFGFALAPEDPVWVARAPR